ncbi:MAG: biotin transporter BioY [Actinobacteria bacterium]|nr:biotin transporter BioY [Actinomycetota bacterium]
MDNDRVTNARTTRGLALAALFAALTAAGAYVSFPLYGAVPFSLQVLVVLLAGLLLGARLAALSMAAYLLVGLVAPVYAGGASGFGVLVGPAGGYLWGFIAGAALTGLIVERRRVRSIAGLAAAAAAGLLPIYALGASWLAFSLRVSDPAVVVGVGVLQFLPGDLLKVVAAALVARALAAAPLELPALDRNR